MRNRTLARQLAALESRKPAGVPHVEIVHDGEPMPAERPDVLVIRFRKDWCGNDAWQRLAEAEARTTEN